MEVTTLEQVPSGLNYLIGRVHLLELLLQSAAPLAEKTHPQYLTVPEVTNLLSISATTLYSLARQNLIPHSRRGRRLYFNYEELLGWIAEGKNSSKSSSHSETEIDFIAAVNRKRKLP